MSTNFYYLAAVTFALGACAFALWKGDRPERIAAVIVIANLGLGLLRQNFTSSSDDVFLLVNDGLAAIALLVLALRFPLVWLGGAMLLSALQFGLHSFYLVESRPADRAFAVINNMNFYGLMWCLIIGTAVAWRRRVVASKQADPFPKDSALQAVP